jgi:NDP-sugar pyrophosphorylase family protein
MVCLDPTSLFVSSLISQVTKVAEPSAYGVVVTKPNSTVIDRFVEKPVEFVGNRINAGIYMFNPSVLARIEVSVNKSKGAGLTVAQTHVY